MGTAIQGSVGWEGSQRTMASVDAVMVIAAGNGVVKEDIAARLEVYRAYLLGL